MVERKKEDRVREREKDQEMNGVQMVVVVVAEKGPSQGVHGNQ